MKLRMNCPVIILEIEDQRVGAKLARLGELALRAAGDKEQRTQLHFGFLIINATRRKVATISLR
jgi:hypothetical protein